MSISISPSRPKSLYHQRRGSGRRASGGSSYSVPTSPNVESPRTLCPRDADAFSYSPSHLPAWYISQQLWDRLPKEMQSALAALQHSGAAVLTSYERIEQHSSNISTATPEQKPSLDHITLSELRAASFSSSAMTSPSVSSRSSSMSSSPAMSPSQYAGPVSPMTLSPPEVTQTEKRHHERSFSTPLEPRDAYYTTELSYLRTECLPRIRHAARKVDTEWYEAKRLGAVSQDDAVEFEKWWSDKKAWIRQLDDRGRRLSSAMGVSPAGLGWSGP